MLNLRNPERASGLNLSSVVIFAGKLHQRPQALRMEILTCCSRSVWNHKAVGVVTWSVVAKALGSRERVGGGRERDRRMRARRSLSKDAGTVEWNMLREFMTTGEPKFSKELVEFLESL